MNNFKLPADNNGSASTSHSNSSTQLHTSNTASAGSLGWVLSGANVGAGEGGSANAKTLKLQKIHLIILHMLD